MRVCSRLLGAILVVTMVSATVLAQPPDRGEGRGGRGRDRGQRPEGARQFQPPRMPILAALDADRDGEISSEEINNAVAALKSLDKNGDGKLTRNEVLPAGTAGRGRFAGGRAGGPRGEGGAAGRRGQGGGPGGRQMLQRIMSMDKNQDGKVTKEEAPERLQPMFARVDANGDGAIDEPEIRQFVRQRVERGGGGPEGDRPRRTRRPGRPAD